LRRAVKGADFTTAPIIVPFFYINSGPSPFGAAYVFYKGRQKLTIMNMEYILMLLSPDKERQPSDNNY
jgi:hypothetical protein